jgi:hypothetical protein
MATIIIRREPAFKRGMLSIEILADGQKAGSLWNSQPCRVDIAPGRHTILARKLGNDGQPFDITIAEGETRYLALHDVDNSRGFIGLLVLTTLITSIPDDLLGGLLMLWIKIAFLALEVAVLAYVLRQRTRKKLTITDDQAARGGIAAGAILQ